MFRLNAADSPNRESGLPRRTTDDDGDAVDLEANCDDNDEVFLTTAKIIANDGDFSEGNGEVENGEQQKEGSLTEGLCFNVMIGVTIMVVILAIGSAMLWTAQRLMNVSQVRDREVG